MFLFFYFSKCVVLFLSVMYSVITNLPDWAIKTLPLGGRVVHSSASEDLRLLMTVSRASLHIIGGSSGIIHPLVEPDLSFRCDVISFVASIPTPW